jgi:hypothetical protein
VKMYHTEYAAKRGTLRHFRRVVDIHDNIQVHIRKDEKVDRSEITMTLKRVYPLAYQRVQGAFKDSMIH